MTETVVERDNNIYVALSVDVRVVPVGALKEHLVVLASVRVAHCLKCVLDRVVRVARLNDRPLMRPRIELRFRNSHSPSPLQTYSRNSLSCCSRLANDSLPRWRRMLSFWRLCSNKSVAMSGFSNVSLMRMVPMSVNKIARSCSIDCVLISSVFCNSLTLSRYFFANHILKDCGGSGYTPTPTLTTRRSA